MNPFLMQIANGHAFFAGILMAIAALLFCAWKRNKFTESIMVVAVTIGVFCVLISATPIPIWEYVVWIVLVEAEFAGLKWRLFDRFRPIVHGTCLALLLLCSLGLCLQELPYHFDPKIQISANQTIYVIGDSISAGVDKTERTWPAALAQLSGLKVVNLAEPGVRAKGGLAQANDITSPSSVVIIEIGGNDVLGGGNSKTFRRNLDLLLARLQAQNQRLVIFEIPLPPFYNFFGMAQRQLAKKYGVQLIPKSCMTNILEKKGLTSDGIHFSPTGHDAFAAAVYRMIHIQGAALR